jgi:hypothetical protein
MALTTLNLSINVYVNDTCDNLILQDTTGNYSASNPFGYGSPNGIFINDVDTLVMTLNYTPLGISVVYSFTIVNGTITAATINFNGIGAINILTQLVSTTFPFVAANPFTFFSSYINSVPATVTLPTIEDGAYSVTYRITGTADDNGTPTPFDLSANDMVLMKCSTMCCIREAFSKVDENCNCNDGKINPVITAQAYVDIAEFAVEDEDSARANTFINRAKALCDCDCGCH